MSSADKQIEEFLGKFFSFIGQIIVAFFKALFRGIKKLRKRSMVLGLLIAIAVAVVTRFLLRNIIFDLAAPGYIRWSIYVIGLSLPVWYLVVIGGMQDKSQQYYDQLFSEIGFVGKDKKVPYYCGSDEIGKKKVYTFKSNIPLTDWKAAKPRLETALDCNILKMEYGNSKRLVKLTVLPAEFKIPEMIRWEDSFCNDQNGVISVGQGALDVITFNLNRVPHVLVAGETGSGKSVILRCILWQMILQGCRVFMIDFKGGVEFGKQYEHYGEVITDRERALEVLEMLVQENEYRLSIFRDLEVKNLAEYNKKTHQNLCRIGVFSDEIAEMLDKKGVSKENKQIYEQLEAKLSTLARLSRATGINLFLGVQRPDATVLTGQIKNNVPVRISGRFADKAASEIVLGNTDAVDLPDIKGRFLYKVGNETIEFQSFYFDDETMLRDVDVEVGDMLTMAPSYTPRRTAAVNSSTTSAPKTVSKRTGKWSKTKPSENKNKTINAPKEEPVKVQAYQDETGNVVIPYGEEVEVDLDFDFGDFGEEAKDE